VLSLPTIHGVRLYALQKTIAVDGVSALKLGAQHLRVSGVVVKEPKSDAAKDAREALK
jgi:hypothetical protein